MNEDTNNINESNTAIIAVNVGNSRTGVGLFAGKDLTVSARVGNDDVAAVHAQIKCYIDQAEQTATNEIYVVIASVNDEIANLIRKELVEHTEVTVLRIGQDVAIPIGQQLDREALPGDDRLINAAAAFDRIKQACVVVDAGTAVTVDFVDGEGTFHGGAIAPGCQLQLDALHNNTAQLPEMTFAAPDSGDAFGPNTQQAMLHGVFYGVRGMVRHLIERYATEYAAYPAVIATGGDAQVLFDKDELVDTVDADLSLRGIAACCRIAIEQEQGELESNSDSSQADENH